MKIQNVLRLAAAMLAMVVSQTVCAYDFEDGGIYYNITSETTAEVTRSGSGFYSGVLDIPSEANNAGETYSVTMIGRDAFSGCGDLISVALPGSVTSIGDYAFYACYNLASVSIPGSVTSIGIGAFYDCYDLASVSIPGSVTSIGVGAFFNCLAMTSVSIPSSVTFIGESAFENCKSLSYISVESGNKHYADKEGVLFNRDMTELMVFPISHAKTEYVIPSTVTSVGNRSFWGCSGLTSVTVPSSVISIGENAFNGCHGLTSVTVPASVTSIGVSAFVNCQNLSSISVESGNGHYADKEGVLFNHDISELLVFPAGYANTGYVIPSSVSAIAYSAFGDCHGLTSVSIPSSVTSIGDYAFGDCRALTTVSIPSSVASIGVGVFGNCMALTSVDLPSSVTSIGDYAFGNCRILASVTLPPALASIGNSAFNSCLSLTSVDLPASLTSIGDGAFYGCEGLTAVYCRWTKALECSEYLFSNDVYERCTLYAPRRIPELMSYRTTKPWSNFKNIKGTDYSGMEGVYGDTEGVVVSVAGGDVCVAGAAEGACVEVYSSGGECVYRGSETRICGLGRGVYVVRVCGKSFKVVLGN